MAGMFIRNYRDNGYLELEAAGEKILFLRDEVDALLAAMAALRELGTADEILKHLADRGEIEVNLFSPRFTREELNTNVRTEILLKE